MANSSTTLPGFTAAETVLMAAAFYHAPTAEVNKLVDWEKVTKHIQSASVASVKTRVYNAKKKVVDLDDIDGGEGSSSSKIPAGRIDKKSPGKVKGGPKSAGAAEKKGSKQAAFKKTKVKEEEEATEPDKDFGGKHVGKMEDAGDVDDEGKAYI